MKNIKQGRVGIIKMFLKTCCPYCAETEISYACDGTPLTDRQGVEKREPCKYYGFNGTFKSGCNHPKRWC